MESSVPKIANDLEVAMAESYGAVPQYEHLVDIPRSGPVLPVPGSVFPLLCVSSELLTIL